MSPYFQTIYVVWGNLILFILMSISHSSFWMIPVALIANFIFGFMSESSLHRYYTHKSFITSSIIEKILRVFALLAGQGAILSWVTVHRTHHAYEDTAKDPHSPLYHKWWKIFLGIFPVKYQKNLSIDLIRTGGGRYYIWENKYYWAIWSTIWILSYLVNFWIFYFIVSGAAVWYISTSLVNIFSHSLVLGEKTHNDSVATNSKILNIVTSIGYHNNHHKYPRRYHYNDNDSQIDLYGWLIKKLLIKQ